MKTEEIALLAGVAFLFRDQIKGLLNIPLGVAGAVSGVAGTINAGIGDFWGTKAAALEQQADVLRQQTISQVANVRVLANAGYSVPEALSFLNQLPAAVSLGGVETPIVSYSIYGAGTTGASFTGFASGNPPWGNLSLENLTGASSQYWTAPGYFK